LQFIVIFLFFVDREQIVLLNFKQVLDELFFFEVNFLVVVGVLSALNVNVV